MVFWIPSPLINLKKKDVDLDPSDKAFWISAWTSLQIQGGGGGLGQKTCFLTPQLKPPTNKSLNDELHTAEKVHHMMHENGKNMTVLSLDFAQRFVFKDNICVKLNYTTKQIQERYAVWLES